MVERNTAEVEEKGYEDDDFQHYVYEAAMEAVYGQGYWAWFNERIRRG
jgi:hypothetical protein